jgi:hypothetical protein
MYLSGIYMRVAKFSMDFMYGELVQPRIPVYNNKKEGK